jgi:DNA-binding response OmpR family regulator
VVDDNDMNLMVVRKLLSETKIQIDTASSGAECLKLTQIQHYDAILMDHLMPKIDGFGVLRHIRNTGKSAPVLFLTAKDSVADRVKGLDSGADDYLIKPFSLEELTARIRAMTRKKFNIIANILQVGDLTLDTGSHTVKRGENEIMLSAKEYNLLEYLMLNKGIVLSREKIENHIWNFEYEGGTNVVDVYISYLRKKIDGNCRDKLIHTVRGYGYMIEKKV